MPATSSTPVPDSRKRASGIVVPNAPTRFQRALAWVITTLMRLLAATLRYRVYDPAGGLALAHRQPVIFALWHNRLALCLKAYEFVRDGGLQETKVAALISASKDGALLSAILTDFKIQPVRGSSSRRGAQALVELTTWAERGYYMAVTPDGPRGPCYSVQHGIMTLAQVTGLPVVPFSCRLGWKIRIKSWDRFQIPLPFSRCDVYWGAPIAVPRSATDEDRAVLREKLRVALMALVPEELGTE